MTRTVGTIITPESKDASDRLQPGNDALFDRFVNKFDPCIKITKSAWIKIGIDGRGVAHYACAASWRQP